MAESTTERLVSFLPYCLKNGENIKIYFSVFAELFDELIQVFVQIQQSRDIDQSELYGLDILGDIVGELRNGLEDTKYLENLRTKIRRNRSNGDIETLNDFARSILGNDFIGFSETDTSGTLQLQYNFPRTNMMVQDPLALLQKIKALGIKTTSVLNSFSDLTNYYGMASYQNKHEAIKPQILTTNSAAGNNYCGMAIHQNKHLTVTPQILTSSLIHTNNYCGMASHQSRHLVIKPQILDTNSSTTNNYYGNSVYQTKHITIGSD